MTNSTETKKLHKLTKGDELVQTFHPRHGAARRTITTVKRTTQTQIVVEDGSKYWSTTTNCGRMVGRASQNWRQNFSSPFSDIEVVKSDEQRAEIIEEMAARKIQQDEDQKKADEVRAAKLERRSGRFEGVLDKYKTKVEEMLADDQDNELLKRMAAQLYNFIWQLEDNEKSLKEKITYAREDLERTAERLDSDLHFAPMTTDYRVDEAVAERKQLIEQAKHALYIVKAVTGKLEEETDES